MQCEYYTWYHMPIGYGCFNIHDLILWSLIVHSIRAPKNDSDIIWQRVHINELDYLRSIFLIFPTFQINQDKMTKDEIIPVCKNRTLTYNYIEGKLLFSVTLSYYYFKTLKYSLFSFWLSRSMISGSQNGIYSCYELESWLYIILVLLITIRFTY